MISHSARKTAKIWTAHGINIISVTGRSRIHTSWIYRLTAQRKKGTQMKRLVPEEDDCFWIAVALAAFLTFCISALYAIW